MRDEDGVCVDVTVEVEVVRVVCVFWIEEVGVEFCVELTVVDVLWDVEGKRVGDDVVEEDEVVVGFAVVGVLGNSVGVT